MRSDEISGRKDVNNVNKSCKYEVELFIRTVQVKRLSSDVVEELFIGVKLELNETRNKDCDHFKLAVDL